jgi:hypothetical protein
MKIEGRKRGREGLFLRERKAGEMGAKGSVRTYGSDNVAGDRPGKESLDLDTCGEVL